MRARRNRSFVLQSASAGASAVLRCGACVLGDTATVLGALRLWVQRSPRELNR
jgi:hypothetical protein